MHQPGEPCIYWSLFLFLGKIIHEIGRQECIGLCLLVTIDIGNNRRNDPGTEIGSLFAARIQPFFGLELGEVAGVDEALEDRDGAGVSIGELDPVPPLRSLSDSPMI